MRYRLRNFFRNRSVILMYHQVCKRISDPWDLAVTPENFDAQMSFLKRNYEVVPLDDLVRNMQSRKLSAPRVAITFDDGFRDNFHNALPVLKRYDIPATFYCTTHAPDSGQLYWWDELQVIILQTDTLPRSLFLTPGNVPFRFEFTGGRTLNSSMIRDIGEWRAGRPCPNERVQLFEHLWQRIQPLPYPDQRKTMNELRKWAGIDVISDASASVMDPDELAALSGEPLFTIGAHTVHHAMLGRQEAVVQAFEVQQSKKTIERWLGRPVTAFSYPYGNYTGTTKALLRAAGYDYAVSTENRCATGSDDLFELPRIQVKNWNENEFSATLSLKLYHENQD